MQSAAYINSYKFPIRKIFLSVPCIHYKLMKLIFAICSVLSLSSLWQQHLGKTYGLRYQIGVTVSDSFAFGETKNSRQYGLLVLRLTLVT